MVTWLKEHDREVKDTQLGRSSVKVSELGLGTTIYGEQVDKTSSIQILKHAIALGIRFIDTADVYVHGRSDTR
jgi:aryl-alcohol dehydrogenase-like predicted oxidoreductase